MSISVPALNFDKLKPNRMHCIIGKRGDGSNEFLHQLVHNLQVKSDAFVIGILDDLTSNHYFAYMYKFCHIITPFSNLEHVISEQKSNPEKEIIIIFGDYITCQKGVLNSEVIRDLCFNGRNHKITTIFKLQYAMELRCHVRSQLDYVYAFGDTNRSNCKRLWEYFFGMHEFNQFLKIFRELTTEPNVCLIHDMTINSKTPIYYFYKVDINVCPLIDKYEHPMYYKIICASYHRILKTLAKYKKILNFENADNYGEIKILEDVLTESFKTIQDNSDNKEKMQQELKKMNIFYKQLSMEMDTWIESVTASLKQFPHGQTP